MPHTEPSVVSRLPEDADAAAVGVSHLRRVYTTPVSEVVAVDDLSWETRGGEAIALMGPSGCGKTTLLNLVSGMDRATSGSVRVLGEEVTTLDEEQLETFRLRRVGYIFQFFNLIPDLTAMENLELPPLLAGMSKRDRRERAQTLLSQVGLSDKARKRPDELSGGEQQRVAICIALMNDPFLIVGDEPTGNLDSRNRDIIVELLLSLAYTQGKAVIMATHDPKISEAFSRVYHMRDGRFVDE